MQVTAKADYALRALAELAVVGEAGVPVKADQIAQGQNIPVKFLENILLELKHDGLVTAQRGASGGYTLARSPEQITLADAIRAVDGPLANVRGIRPDQLEYEGSARLLREIWIAVRANLRAVLEQTTVADLVRGDLPANVTAILRDPDAWTPH